MGFSFSMMLLFLFGQISWQSYATCSFLNWIEFSRWHRTLLQRVCKMMLSQHQCSIHRAWESKCLPSTVYLNFPINVYYHYVFKDILSVARHGWNIFKLQNIQIIREHSAKSKCSKCLLFKWEVTAFWPCIVSWRTGWKSYTADSQGQVDPVR